MKGKLLLFLLSCVLGAAAGEAAVRLFVYEDLLYVPNERSELYRHDDTLGWFPRESSEGSYTALRTITTSHNSDGFRDVEHGPKDRPRLLVVGDSFVWGFDVEQGERFSDILQEKLPGIEIFNMGVSGYGTDQEFLLLKRFASGYKPDAVFLLFHPGNDFTDNSTNMRLAHYFKPYFTVDAGGALELQGVPVPKSLVGFWNRDLPIYESKLVRLIRKSVHEYLMPEKIRTEQDPTPRLVSAMRELVEKEGAMLVAGLTAESPQAEALFQSKGIELVVFRDIERAEKAGRHWTAAGHRHAADQLLEFLQPRLERILERRATAE